MGIRPIDAKSAERKLERIINSINSNTVRAASFYRRKDYDRLIKTMEDVVLECREAIELKKYVKHPPKGLDNKAKGWLTRWHKEKLYSEARKEQKNVQRQEQETTTYQRSILDHFPSLVPRFVTTGVAMFVLFVAPQLKMSDSSAEWLNVIEEETVKYTNSAQSSTQAHDWIESEETVIVGGSNTLANIQAVTERKNVITNGLESKVDDPIQQKTNSFAGWIAVTDDTGRIETKAETDAKPFTNGFGYIPEVDTPKLADTNNIAALMPKPPETNKGLVSLMAEAPETNRFERIETTVTILTNRPAQMVESNAQQKADTNRLAVLIPETYESNKQAILVPEKGYQSNIIKGAVTQKTDVQDSYFNRETVSTQTIAPVRTVIEKPVIEVKTTGTNRAQWEYVTHTARWGETATSIIKRYQGIEDDALVHSRIEEFNRDNRSTRDDFISFPGGRFVQVKKDGEIIYKYIGGKRSDKPDDLGDAVITGKEYRVRVYRGSV